MPLPTPILPTATAHAALIEATTAALAASAQRTVVLEHGGQRYVAKRLADRPRRVSQALFLRWLVKRVSGQSLPMRTLLLSEAASSIGYEAGRLESLARAGVRVPRVVHQAADYLLLEHCGETVAMLIAGWPLATCRSEMLRLADELGAFHRAGQWHGGAQIKNLTRKDGLTFRIDFEEDFGDRVPLPAAQALDLVLFLNSVSLAGPVDEGEARVLLPSLLAAYFAAQPDPQVRAALVRGLPWVAALARLASPFRRLTSNGRPRKGAARLVILADALAASLKAP
jgi:tRNA A-37 threonylcarbamoyl transferase component Bud32